MRDPVIEREGYYATEKRRRYLEHTDGQQDGCRCPICGCRPAIAWSHVASPEFNARTGATYITTCASHYCRSKDPR